MKLDCYGLCPGNPSNIFLATLFDECTSLNGVNACNLPFKKDDSIPDIDKKPVHEANDDTMAVGFKAKIQYKGYRGANVEIVMEGLNNGGDAETEEEAEEAGKEESTTEPNEFEQGAEAHAAKSRNLPGDIDCTAGNQNFTTIIRYTNSSNSTNSTVFLQSAACSNIDTSFINIFVFSALTCSVGGY